MEFQIAVSANSKKSIGPSSTGDLSEVWANVDKAAKVLHWRAERDLAAMCRDAWNWQVRNLEGYKG